MRSTWAGLRAAGLTVEQAAEASTAISALPTINLAGVACVVSCPEPCIIPLSCSVYGLSRQRDLQLAKRYTPAAEAGDIRMCRAETLLSMRRAQARAQSLATEGEGLLGSVLSMQRAWAGGWRGGRGDLRERHRYLRHMPHAHARLARLARCSVTLGAFSAVVRTRA